MFIKHCVKPLFLALIALVGLNACTSGDLDYGSTEQLILPPATITATAISDTRIQVSWSSQAPMGAVKYYIEQATAAAGPFAYVGSTLEPTVSYTAIGLTPNTTYFFRVTSVHGDGSESLPGGNASATTFGGAGTGGAPTGVSATAISNSQIQVSWTTAPPAFKYYVQRSTSASGPFVFVGSVLEPSTSFLDGGLTPATTYFYQIVAVFPDNSESGPSTPLASATTFGGIAPPTNVTATAISFDRITVAWTAAPNAVKYYVFRSLASTGPFVNVGTVLAPGTSLLDVGLLPSTTYFYFVHSVDLNDAESADSNIASATTPAVGGGLFEGYWKFDERTGSVAGDSSGFFRDGTLSGGATFDTMDKAQLDDNRSVLSSTGAVSSVVTVPAAPGLNMTGSFTVAFWTKASGSVRFVGQRPTGCTAGGWEFGQDGGGLYFQGELETRSFGQSLPANTWTHVAATHAGGTMRLYVNGAQVATGPYTSVNSVGGNLVFGHPGGCAGGAFLLDEAQVYSRELTAMEIATLGTLPPAPTGLVTTSKTSASITLSWNMVPGATSYILSKGTGAGPITTYTHVPASATYEVDHLMAGTSYTFNVRAVVNGLYSNASANLTDSTVGGLAAPSGVTAMVISADRILVSWTAVPNAFKYYVFESVNAGPYTFVGSMVDPQTSLLRANLAAATTFSYQVQAEDSAQQTSPMSTPVSAMTP